MEERFGSRQEERQPDQAGSYCSGPDQDGSSLDEAVVDKETWKSLVNIQEVKLTGLVNEFNMDMGIKKKEVSMMTCMNHWAHPPCLEMEELGSGK